MARFSDDIGRMRDPNLVVAPVQSPDMSGVFDLFKGINRGRQEARLETDVESAISDFLSSNKEVADSNEQLAKRNAEGSTQLQMLTEQVVDEDPDLSFEQEDDQPVRSETARMFEEEITRLKSIADQGGMSVNELNLRIERATRAAIDRMPGLAPGFRQLASARLGDFKEEIRPYLQQKEFTTKRAEQLAKAETEDAIEASRNGMSLPAYKQFRATKAQADMAKELAKEDSNRFAVDSGASYETDYSIAANQFIMSQQAENGLYNPDQLSRWRQSYTNTYLKHRQEIQTTAAERGWNPEEVDKMLTSAEKRYNAQLSLIDTADKAKVYADTIKLMKDDAGIRMFQTLPALTALVTTYGQASGDILGNMREITAVDMVINDPNASPEAKMRAENKKKAMEAKFPWVKMFNEMQLNDDPRVAAKFMDFNVLQLTDSVNKETPTANYPGFVVHDILVNNKPMGSPEVEAATARTHVKYSWIDADALSTFTNPNAATKVLADPKATRLLRERTVGEIASIARGIRDTVEQNPVMRMQQGLGGFNAQDVLRGTMDKEALVRQKVLDSMDKFSTVSKLINMYGNEWYGHTNADDIIQEVLIKEGIIPKPTPQEATRSQAQQDVDDIRRVQQQARQPMAGVTPPTEASAPVVEDNNAEFPDERQQAEPVGVVNPATGMGRPISSQESIDALPPGLRSQMTPIDRAVQPDTIVPEEDLEMQESIPQSTIDLLHDREGFRDKVYKDSLGKPTVGYGHLIRPGQSYTLEDGTVKKGSELVVGDRISRQELDALFQKNVQEAYVAATNQAAEAGITDPEFLDVLTSVNFQLGTNWTTKFFNSWPAIKRGDYDKAIEGIKNSKWAKQTPVRVNDFVKVLEKLKANKTSMATPQRLEPGTYIIDGELVEIS